MSTFKKNKNKIENVCVSMDDLHDICSHLKKCTFYFCYLSLNIICLCLVQFVI